MCAGSSRSNICCISDRALFPNAAMRSQTIRVDIRLTTSTHEHEYLSEATGDQCQSAMAIASYSNLLLATFLVSFVSLVGYALYLRYQPYLRDVPGPVLASFTDLWRLLKLDGGRFELENQQQHERHGDLVRVGPNCVSVGDPREIRQIYGISRLFEKVRRCRLYVGMLVADPQYTVELLSSGSTHRPWQTCSIALHDHK